MSKILLVPFLLSIISFVGIVYFSNKIKKMLVEDFYSNRSPTDLWNYYSKVYADSQQVDKIRERVTKGIADHHTNVEKFRMSKKVAKPIQ